jgi:hypothetical protein
LSSGSSISWLRGCVLLAVFGLLLLFEKDDDGFEAVQHLFYAVFLNLGGGWGTCMFFFWSSERASLLLLIKLSEAELLLDLLEFLVEVLHVTATCTAFLVLHQPLLDASKRLFNRIVHSTKEI